MRKLKIMLATVLALGYCFGAAVADEDAVTFYTEDKSPAIRIHNGYDAGTDVRVVITAGDDAANYVVVGTVTNTMDWSGANATVAQVAALIGACTNTAGAKKITVAYDCALAGDSTDDEVMDSQDTTVKSGDWGDVVLWDTSTAKFYSAYIPSSETTGMSNDKVIKKIYGNIGGTGNITLNIYVDGVEKYEKVIVSPVYIPSANTGASNSVVHAEDEVGPAQLDIDLNFPARKSEAVVIRATRASTGTTGSIGAIVDYK